jgi:MFS1 family protein
MPLPKDVLSTTDPHLLIPKLLYFWLNMLVYASYTFTADYLVQVYNFPLYAFGYLSTVCLISFMGALGWTMVADKRRARKRMLMGAVIVYACTFSLLKLGSVLFFPTHKDDHPPAKGVSLPKTLYLMTIFVLSNFSISVMYPLLDSQIFEALKRREDHLLFGRQRMWGTIGQAIITIINGAGIGRLGWDALFGSVVGCSCTFLVIAFLGLSNDEEKDTKHPNPEEKSQTVIATDLSAPLFSLSFVLFLCTALIFGFGRAVLGNFLPTYLSQTLGHPPIMIGIILSFRIITELMVFIFNGQLITWIGVGGMFVIGQLASALRALLYSLLTNNMHTYIIPFMIETLKGVSNGMMISAGIHLTDQLTPQARRSTAQGLFSGIHGNVANALSGIVCGLVLHTRNGDGQDKHGDALRDLFRWTSYVLLVTLLVYCVVERRLIVGRGLNR